MSYTFVKAISGDVGKSLVDNEQIEYCYNCIKKAVNNKVKLLLPIDNVCAENFDGEIKICRTNKFDKNLMGLDIGPKTIKLYRKIIKHAKTIIINGPMGAFEHEKFSIGTNEIIKAIAKNRRATKVAGGGDTTLAIEKLNLKEKFTHVSTGGGASLKLLEGSSLPAVENLSDKENTNE